MSTTTNKSPSTLRGRCEADLVERARKYMELTKRSQGYLVREAVEEYLRRHGPEVGLNEDVPPTPLDADGILVRAHQALDRAKRVTKARS